MYLAIITDQVPSAIVAGVSLEAMLAAWVFTQLATITARWIAMSEAIILTFHERVVRHSKLWSIFCFAENALWKPTIEANPAEASFTSGAFS
jgi:hypothetical protein